MPAEALVSSKSTPSAGQRSAQVFAGVTDDPFVKKYFVAVGLLAAVAVAVYVVRVTSSWQANARTSKFKIDVENLFAGLQQYKENMGQYPRGSNAELIKALQVNNPKKLIILVSRKAELNEKGEMLDPWGTPLRIYFSDVGVLVRSAGPNRRFDDSTTIESDDFYRSN